MKAPLLDWAYPLAWPELAAGAAFVLLYVGYAVRTWRLAAPLRRRGWRLGWKLLLRLAYFGLLLLALLGPAYGVTQQPVRTAGKDVWLLVDLSRSMDAPDVLPTRLLKARAELSELISRFQADRIGLVVFAADAFVQCPLTYDQGALQLFINTLQTNLVPVGTTDLTPALDLVLQRLNALPTPAGSPPRATAVVLVSDGEDFGENLEPVVRQLSRAGVRLFTMGVGTQEGTRIPRTGGGYVHDARGRDGRDAPGAADATPLSRANGRAVLRADRPAQRVSPARQRPQPPRRPGRASAHGGRGRQPLPLSAGSGPRANATGYRCDR